jgi:hypothetical protein
MSIIRVDSIVNKTQDGRPLLSIGASISAGYALTANGLTIPGTIFATSFQGDGSQIVNIPLANSSKIIAIKILGVWFDDYRY